MEEGRDQNRMPTDYASSVQREADIDHGNGGKNCPSNPPSFHPTPANAGAEDESRTATASRTHDNLFGPSQVSSRQRKIYHMASDIFGVGSIVDRSGSHVPGPGLRTHNPATAATLPIVTNTNDFVPVTQAFADRDSAKIPQAESGGMRDIEGNIIDQTMDLPSVPGTPIAETESPKFHARDNGSNPVTGDGYIHDETPKKSKSQRRHYPQVNSPSLW